MGQHRAGEPIQAVIMMTLPSHYPREQFENANYHDGPKVAIVNTIKATATQKLEVSPNRRKVQVNAGRPQGGVRSGWHSIIPTSIRHANRTQREAGFSGLSIRWTLAPAAM